MAVTKLIYQQDK